VKGWCDLEQISVNGRTFKQQMRNCGKACCKGVAGGIHGPYWYVFEPGKAQKYVGTVLPPGVRGYLDRLAAAMPAILERAGVEREEERALEQRAREHGRAARVCSMLKAGQTVTEADVMALGFLELLPMP
jgi:hypothetical protein